MKTTLLAGLALTLGTLTGGAPAELSTFARQDGLPVFPVPDGPLEVPARPGGEDLRLLDLCDLYAAATGQTLMYSAETLEILESESLSLTGSLTIPAERVQFVFETLLIENALVLRLLSEEPRILSLSSLNTGARATIRDQAIRVPAGDVERLREHPAMLFTTVVDLPRVDVRQLANSMRSFIIDANVQQMLPVGSTSSIMLTGFGDQVASMAVLLRGIDAVQPEPVAPEEAGGERK